MEKTDIILIAAIAVMVILGLIKLPRKHKHSNQPPEVCKGCKNLSKCGCCIMNAKPDKGECIYFISNK